jgi:hypothetical protein
MSRDNVKLVRELIATANAAGWASDAVAGFLAADARAYPHPSFPGPDSYDGREATLEFVRE